MIWPENKKFAFTIVDDTDEATLENIKPVYDLLNDLKLKTTKTVWIEPSRDKFTGDCLKDEPYLNFILDLQNKGFEIAFHGVGSGSFSREEILNGLTFYKEKLGDYPKMHINHAQNPHNLFWGNSGGSKLLQVYSKWRIPHENYYGHVPSSKYFWGDFLKKHIKYMRARTSSDINTLKFDPKMPYRDKDKDKYSNFWFSSSDGAEIKSFTNLICKENIDRLVSENGLCIVYTHFGCDFVKNKQVDEHFKENMAYLSKQEGWFAPASEILDYLLQHKKSEYESEWFFTYLDLKRALDKRGY